MSKESTVIFRAISTPQIIFKSPKNHMVTFNPGKHFPSDTELKFIISFFKTETKQNIYISRLISIGPQSIMTVYAPDHTLPRFNYTQIQLYSELMYRRQSYLFQLYKQTFDFQKRCLLEMLRNSRAAPTLVRLSLLYFQLIQSINPLIQSIEEVKFHQDVLGAIK